jgi:hypothetical protein
LVGKISLREDSGASSAVIPAACSSGTVSSKMRPLDKAMVIMDLFFRMRRYIKKLTVNLFAKLCLHLPHLF